MKTFFLNILLVVCFTWFHASAQQVPTPSRKDVSQFAVPPSAYDDSSKKTLTKDQQGAKGTSAPYTVETNTGVPPDAGLKQFILPGMVLLFGALVVFFAIRSFSHAKETS